MASSAAVPVHPIVLWLLVAPAAVWALVRVLGLERGTLLVQLTAFTPYLAALSVIPLVVALLARNPWAVAVAAVACVGLGVSVLPRSFGGASAAPGRPLTVMSINLRLGEADLESIVDLVRSHDVDVLTLQEFPGTADNGLVAAGLLEVLPYSERHATAGAEGSGLFSRFPLSGGGVTINPGWGFEQARAVVHPPDGPAVTVESVHPVPPVADGLEYWLADLRAQTPAPTEGLHVLAGDFNATLDHAELRRLVGTGYHDAASAVGAGFVSTWPYYGARSAVTPKVTIDHILVSRTIAVRSFTAVTVAHTDHRAIISTLVLPN